MNICTEFGIWLRTLSSSSSGGVASRLAMRKPVMDSSLQSWCVASPFGRTFLHNLCRHYLEKQIDLLKRYKKSIISHAVTRGIVSSLPLKDSGIEYIGQIPAHWDVKRMKYILSTPLQYGANETGDEYNEDWPRYIRITDITEDNELKDEGKQSLPPDVAKPYLLKDGDVLFARSGATVGKTFQYTTDCGTAAFAGYLIKAQTDSSKVLPRFLYYSTLSTGYENWKNMVFTQEDKNGSERSAAGFA